MLYIKLPPLYFYQLMYVQLVSLPFEMLLLLLYSLHYKGWLFNLLWKLYIDKLFELLMLFLVFIRYSMNSDPINPWKKLLDLWHHLMVTQVWGVLLAFSSGYCMLSPFCFFLFFYFLSCCILLIFNTILFHRNSIKLSIHESSSNMETKYEHLSRRWHKRGIKIRLDIPCFFSFSPYSCSSLRKTVRLPCFG